MFIVSLWSIGVRQWECRDAAWPLAAAGQAIPQLGKADFGITLKLTIQFDPPPGERFVLDFQGKWDRSKRFKQASDPFARKRFTACWWNLR